MDLIRRALGAYFTFAFVFVVLGICFLAWPQTSMTVSYTHLDVYKRQIKTLSETYPYILYAVVVIHIYVASANQFDIKSSVARKQSQHEMCIRDRDIPF